MLFYNESFNIYKEIKVKLFTSNYNTSLGGDMTFKSFVSY